MACDALITAGSYEGGATTGGQCQGSKGDGSEPETALQALVLDAWHGPDISTDSAVTVVENCS